VSTGFEDIGSEVSTGRAAKRRCIANLCTSMNDVKPLDKEKIAGAAKDDSHFHQATHSYYNL
jgi:hypothetical protein